MPRKFQTIAGSRLALAADAGAQQAWRRVLPPTEPEWPLAYDPLRARTVAVGGAADAEFGAGCETWEQDGASWTQRFPPARPRWLRAHAMARGPSGSMILFGGEFAGTHVDETWSWDGRSWTRLAPARTPPRRRSPALAYDSVRDRTVLFGGLGSVYLSDTWEWDGSTWHSMAPASSPGPRRLHALAFDAARQRTVLFGGWNGREFLGDTWEWDGTSWTQRGPTRQPPASAAAMAFDEQRARSVLVMRREPIGTETWEWDGQEWTRRASSPTPNFIGSLAYDASLARVVMRVGDTTWQWDGVDWRSVAPPNPHPPDQGQIWRVWTEAMAWDSARGRVVLHDGDASGGTWEWDGVDWRLLPSRIRPSDPSTR